MSEIPDQETEKDTSFEEKTSQIDQKKSLKQRHFCQKSLRILGKYALLSFAKTLEYFS